MWAVGGVVAAIVGWRRGRSVANWAFLGLAFSVIAVVVVAVLPRRDIIRLYGISVRRRDARLLVASLLAAETAPAFKAGRTIARELDVDARAVSLTPEQGDAILAVLDDQPSSGLGELSSGLGELRGVLTRAALDGRAAASAAHA